MVNSPYPEGINQLALRISTYEYPLGALLAIYFLSATGHMPSKFRLDHWIKAVQWHGESKVAAFVNTEDEWADAQTLLTPLENILVEADSKQGSVVWSSTQKDHPAIPKDSLPLKLFVRPENDIQRHLPATLHVEATGLGKLGAIACPPQLLFTPPATHVLHLFHYEADQLCVWKPGHRQLDQLQIRFTYVSTEGPAYKEHFGAREHSYSHWLSLDLPTGWWDLARFLFLYPNAASSMKRDATPLRLLSWLSFRLEPAVETLIEEAMRYLSTAEKVAETDLLALGTKHLGMGTPLESVEALRDRLIELVSVRNLKHRPEALFALFRQSLQRLTLPRLCHFLDLVLPQLTPVRAPWADATRTLWTCHHIRAVNHKNGYPHRPKVAIAYFFTSHDNIHHVRVHWGTLPLLLFSDPRVVSPVDVYQFQGQAVHRLNQQHIQLGLRRGMTVLVYYRVQGGAHVNELFQAVLIAQESINKSGKANRKQAVETGCPI